MSGRAGTSVSERGTKKSIEHGVWKSQKKSHATLRAKPATFTFWVNQKCQKCSILASFWKPEACGQTVLPDRSVFIGQKMVQKAKIQKFKCDIVSNFQTMWESLLTFEGEKTSSDRIHWISLKCELFVVHIDFIRNGIIMG